MSNTQGSTPAGKSVGDTVKGIFNAGHGAGETIRGTINDTLDKFGEGVASDGKNTNTENRAAELGGSGAQNHAGTVEKGKQEFSDGFNAIRGAGNQSNPTTTNTTTNTTNPTQ